MKKNRVTDTHKGEYYFGANIASTFAPKIAIGCVCDANPDGAEYIYIYGINIILVLMNNTGEEKKKVRERARVLLVGANSYSYNSYTRSVYNVVEE